MTTDSDSCKQIEDLIKSMIFVKNPDPDLQPQSPSIPDTSLLIKPPLLTATFHKTGSLPEHDLLGNGYSTESSSQSRLIDNDALLRFATENIKERNALFSSENFTEPFGIVKKSPPDLTFPKDATYQQDLVIENPLPNSEEVAHASNSVTSSPLPEKETKAKTKKKKSSGKNNQGEKRARKKLLNMDLKHDRKKQTTMQFSSANSSEEDEYRVITEDGSVYSLSFEENIWELSCLICNYSATCDRCVFPHLKGAKHKKEIKSIAADYALHRLPDPLPAQEEAITELLLKLHEEIGLSAKHLEQRHSVASEVNELISTNLPDCTVVLTGSSVSGCGLQSSEVDIILNVGLNLAAERLSTCHILLSKCGIAKDVSQGFEEKIPKVKFKDTKFDLNCNLIIVDPKRSLPVTSLLALYCNLDPRVPPLTTAFKHFAQLCKLDQPELGTLPSFSFSLLLVYFLQQQTPPVLPVIQEDTKYSKEFDFEAYRATCKWNSKNTDSLGLLWVKLLKFYCLQYQPGQDVVAIRSSKGMKCKDKGWGTKFLAIEDPIEISRNLAHVVPNKCVFSYIMSCFKNAYIYFGHPLLANGPLNFNMTREIISEALSSPSANEKSVDESLTATDSKNDDILNDDDNDMLEDHDADLPIDDVISTISKLTMDDLKINDDEELDVENSTLKSTLLSPLLNPELAKKYNSELKENAKRTVTVGYWDVGNRYITKDMMKYKFPTIALTKGQGLPLVCRLCCRIGHLKKECPEETLPPIKRLPPMTPEFLSCLDKVCILIKEQKQPMPSTLTHNEKDRASLQLWIQDIYPDAELELFGSFCNGFGFDNSDLDFCLTFKDNKSGEGLKHVEIIEALAKKLKTISTLSNVVPITSAKVPIVKFSTKRGKVIRECDISLYNTLAQHNTKMLQMYCSIDERVQGIGFAIKHFAKVLDICDASKGSLSSYAYVLMAIFYLQQRQPPVIPVLQELYKGEKPILMVDNWNAWFFDDLEKLSDAWPEYGQNKESIGELWFGLLSFYASEFDFSSLVISIKQKMPLTRFSKLWQSKKIAIEDPFDLNHNLGAGLSRKMSNYIRKCFIYARSHFGSPFCSEKLKRANSEALLDYFFNDEVLNRGCKPPQDRVCRNCGKIGHMAKNCVVKHEAAHHTPAEPQKYDKRNQNADVGNQRFEKPDKRQVVGANRNKKLPQWNQYDRQPSSNSELPYMNCDVPYINRNHEPLIRHPINMPSQYRHQQQQRVPPPPGFQPHFQNNGLVIRNPLAFPLRPATSSPFPPTSGGNSINNSSPVKPPNVSLLPPTSNSKSWSTNQRLDNYPHANFQNQHWQYRPVARLNLDQSNIGAGLRMRHQSLQQFPTPRFAALDQERSRTNTDLGRLHHPPW